MADPSVLAERALELARGEPLRARALAQKVLDVAADDPAIVAVAERALAIASRESDITTARRHAERAVVAAERSGQQRLQGLSHATLSSVLGFAGEFDRAFVEVHEAERLLGGADLAMAIFQRATLRYWQSDFVRAEEAYSEALAVALDTSDDSAQAMIRMNRGVLFGYMGRTSEATEDFEAALTHFTASGADLLVANLEHNLGWASAVAGDLATALQHYVAARELHTKLGVELPVALLDEARVLLEANLVEEAHATATAAVAGLRAAGQGADLAEALLLLTEASVAVGRPDAAAAAEAQSLFAEQGRPGWSTLAAFTALRLQPDVEPTTARAMADDLVAAGWLDASLDARLLAGGPEDLAAVADHRNRGPAARRLRGWYAQAMLRQAEGDRAGVARAAAAGVRVASTHAVSLAATELRARAGVVVEPLVDLGIGLALEAGRPRRVLLWAERWRAGGLLLGHVGLPADAGLAELRSVLRQLEDEGLPGHRRIDLDRRRRRLEADVDRRTRAAGVASGAPIGDLDIDELRRQLAGRTLVEFVVHHGQVHPVVVDDGRIRVADPVELAALVREVRTLRLAAARLARPVPVEAMRATAAAAAAALDQLLLAPLDLGPEVVLVPSGALHAVPWPLLPSLTRRACTVTPSARLWLRAGATTTARRALVVTTGLAGGADEAEAVAAHYDDAVVLAGDAATSDAVLAALDGVDVAHLAVHANFRSDNPLYSSLELADGPLLVHDLDRLERTPPLVVLSACGAAQTSVDAGDELLGLTASFLRSGTRALVASTLPVADALAPPLMAAFHHALAGASPALALRHAQADEPAHAGAAFTCFGRG